MDALGKPNPKLEKKIEQMKKQWDKEKSSIIGETKIKEEIEKTKIEIEKAERNMDLEKAAELKFCRLIELNKQIEALKQEAGKTQNQLL